MACRPVHSVFDLVNSTIRQCFPVIARARSRVLSAVVICHFIATYTTGYFFWGGAFLKTTPINSGGCAVWSSDQLLSQSVFLPIWLLLFPLKNTGVQVPPLKPPETLAVPTVPPFPRFLKSVTHWMTDNSDR